jgi:hypothetical protein
MPPGAPHEAGPVDWIDSNDVELATPIDHG